MTTFAATMLALIFGAALGVFLLAGALGWRRYVRRVGCILGAVGVVAGLGRVLMGTPIEDTLPYFILNAFALAYFLFNRDAFMDDDREG